MNKKTYIAPSSEVVKFCSEGLMEMTVSVYEGTEVPGGSSWSNRRGWNSDDWTGVDDEEE